MTRVRSSNARNIPAGARLFRVGTLTLPGLIVEQVSIDRRDGMEGWVDLSVWVADGQRNAWTDPAGDETAFLGMIGISVPATASATYEAPNDAR